MMDLITAKDGVALVRTGRVAYKRRNPVYLQIVNHEFQVETNEGVLSGKPGDYVAHDPISGHVWPVAASYVAQHYDFEDQAEGA